jgi:hypothetical protein
MRYNEPVNVLIRNGNVPGISRIGFGAAMSTTSQRVTAQVIGRPLCHAFQARTGFDLIALAAHGRFDRTGRGDNALNQWFLGEPYTWGPGRGELSLRTND